MEINSFKSLVKMSVKIETYNEVYIIFNNTIFEYTKPVLLKRGSKIMTMKL